MSWSLIYLLWKCNALALPHCFCHKPMARSHNAACRGINACDCWLLLFKIICSLSPPLHLTVIFIFIFFSPSSGESNFLSSLSFALSHTNAVCFVKLLEQAESAGGQFSERPLQKTKCLTSPLSTASQTPLQLPIPPDEQLVLVSLFLPLSLWNLSNTAKQLCLDQLE